MIGPGRASGVGPLVIVQEGLQDGAHDVERRANEEVVENNEGPIGDENSHTSREEDDTNQRGHRAATEKVERK